MENKTSKNISEIERVLNSSKLTKNQRETLNAFDRYNELEAKCSLGTRRSYLQSLYELGVKVCKPFEKMTKEDLQNYIHAESNPHKNSKGEPCDGHKEGTIALYEQHIKRFFKWLEWIKVNIGNEEKVDINEVKVPYCVRWIKLGTVDSTLEFEDLPTDEEVKRIAECVETQRDRALLLALWETGASPIEILNLRVKDVAFNQYGAIVKFRRYTKGRTNQVNKLKTPYRYRQVPIATSVPDLQLWLSMHPNKENDEAPLWLSRKGGSLGYHRLLRIFKRAVRKAGIKKHLTPYRFRHKRLTQLADVLGIHELKKVAGHSKHSTTTQRYLHADEKAIVKKIY